MILWLDAQLSPLMAPWLEAQFPGLIVRAVRDLNLRDADDREIFHAARAAEAVVMTKDRDFITLLQADGPPPQVIWLRVGNSSNQALQNVLARTLTAAIQALETGEPWVEIRDSATAG